MNPTVAAARALIRGRDRATCILTICAFALPHTLFLTVIAGVHAFTVRQHEDGLEGAPAGVYVALAYIAAVLLIMPALSMGAAAAKLGLLRRSQDLAVMRLLGLSPMRTKLASVIEVTRASVIGVTIGIALYAATMPMWTLVSFQGKYLTVAEMWAGPLMIAGASLLMIILGMMSTWLAMYRVSVTPLGVVRQSRPARVNVIVIVIAFAIVIAWFLIAPGLFQADLAWGVGIGASFLAVFFVSLNFVGAFTIGIIGRIVTRLAVTPSALLAGRRIIEDPRSLWRSYGNMGLVTFIVGVLYPTINRLYADGSGVDEDQVIFVHDLGQGLLITLGFTFVLAAISTAVNQVTYTIDSIGRAETLLLAGASEGFLNSVRRTEVLTPLLVVLLGALAAGTIFALPVQVGEPSLFGLAVVIGACAIGTVTVAAASEITRPVRRALLKQRAV
ncbi:MAG: ABC transporter permease [Actinomycetaceae bacterium]|nr:ABC transporter permease [Actinomycetaceae bacterium]